MTEQVAQRAESSLKHPSLPLDLVVRCGPSVGPPSSWCVADVQILHVRGFLNPLPPTSGDGGVRTTNVARNTATGSTSLPHTPGTAPLESVIWTTRSQTRRLGIVHVQVTLWRRYPMSQWRGRLRPSFLGRWARPHALTPEPQCAVDRENEIIRLVNGEQDTHQVCSGSVGSFGVQLFYDDERI